jgi:hypothetical protein
MSLCLLASRLSLMRAAALQSMNLWQSIASIGISMIATSMLLVVQRSPRAHALHRILSDSHHHHEQHGCRDVIVVEVVYGADLVVYDSAAS